MFRTQITWIVLVLAVIVAGAYAYMQRPVVTDETAVRVVVENFGKTLQKVSLMGGVTVGEEMSREYGPYITPELLAEWQRDPLSAPGRMTSSPWPERIEISHVAETGSEYRVEGYVIEVTNEGGGINEQPTEALRRPITLTLKKVGAEYRIASVQLSAYPGDGEWVLSSTTPRGIQFMYPARLPTKYISAQDWPPTVTFEGGDYICANETQIVGDRTYCVARASEGAAGSTYITYDYKTQQGDFIARVQFTLRYPQCMNFDGEQQKDCAREQSAFDVNGLVDRIASSIRMH